MKVAVISGITGQDGSYLAELLLSKGYFVIGFSRRVSVNTSERIKHLLTNGNFQFEEGDVCDPLYITTLLTKYRVAEFYNLAAQSHVHTSFTQPVVTTEIDYMGPLNILNCIKNCSPETKFYQASTSEMFGDVFEESDDGAYQDEETYMNPQSPYAIAKLASHHAVRLYRESYGIFGCSGILFNHESPRRGENFVTRKITKWIGEYTKWKNKVNPEENLMIQGLSESDYIYGPNNSRFPKLRLGNLDASRDWGHSKDYVRAMWMMLQHDTADDYVVSTEETYSVRDFLNTAFYEAGIDDWENLVVVDPKFYRPAEVPYLCGVSQKIRKTLGWSPEVTFEQLAKEMVEADING
jgi:GDPmannose 4,6-dehydratase